jgi:molybdenum cofactor synthesis domain-containing protein
MVKAESAVTACVVIIGNEILSGRTQDQNIAYIGKRCDELGINLLECRVVADIEQTIIAAVDECRDKFNYVFTTGGIGPTHDDITAAAIAKLFGLKLERNPAAVEAMMKYYGPDKLNAARLKMADVPGGAVLIDNPVSGAPGFQIENVFVLPGVPMIMQAMFEGITDRLVGGDPVLTANVVTGLTEGELADGLGEIQQEYPRVAIGSYPFFRMGRLGVNIVMRSTDTGLLAAVTEAVITLVRNQAGDIIEPG